MTLPPSCLSNRLSSISSWPVKTLIHVCVNCSLCIGSIVVRRDSNHVRVKRATLASLDGVDLDARALAPRGPVAREPGLSE